MTHHLTGCVLASHLPVQVARRQYAPPSRVPLVVATGVSDRAVVVDVCARAAQRGLRPGMHLFEARRRAPLLQVKVVDAEALEQAATQIEAVLAHHADTYRRVAPGCWRLPLYALGAGFARAGAVADRLRQDIRAATGFDCVLGIATQPVIARIAADVAATASGHCVVRPGAEQSFLAPLPVRALPGVGGQTEEALGRLGITTIGQLARVDVAVLATLCGSRAQGIARAARGLPGAPAEADAETIRRTWQAPGEPESNVHALRARLYAVTAAAGRGLRAHRQAAGAMTVRVTWSDGTVGRHRVDWRRRSDLDRELAAGSRAALDLLLHRRRLAVREVTVTLGDLGARQADLLTVDDGRARRLQQALDGIAQRYGAMAIQPGSLIGLTEPARRAIP